MKPLALTALLVCSLARADVVVDGQKVARDFLPVGALVTVNSHGPEGVLGGLGGEISYVHYLGFGDVYGNLGIGPVAQVQMVNADHVRGALGFEANILFLGLSLAAAIEQGDQTRNANTVFLDLTPYVTFGFVSLGFRVGIPVGAWGSGVQQPIELGGAFTIKFPIPLGGRFPRIRRAL